MSGEFLGCTGLADTRLSHQHGQPATASDGFFHGRPKLYHFLLASCEKLPRLAYHLYHQLLAWANAGILHLWEFWSKN